MPELVRLLGDDAGGETLPPDLRGALLAYLAYADGWLPREQVAFLFWPDTDEAGARRNLRQLLNRSKSLDLRQPLEFEPSRLRWPVNSDVAELRRAVGRQRWDEVVRLYRGDLLAGRPLDSNAGFRAWLDLERESLRNIYRRALNRRAEELEAEREHAAAAALLEPLLDGEDLAEEPLQAYMRNTYLAGRRQLALDAYDRFARRLSDEIELEPLEETQELARTIRSAVPLAGAAPRAQRTAPLQVQRPPQLVGRDVALRSALSATEQVVLLRGEAGVGKSRLLEELAQGAPGARCLEGLQAVPFQAVADLVRGAVRSGWDPGSLGDYREDLARLVPEALPGMPVPPAEPLTARARLLEALSRCLEGAYGSGPGSFHLTLDDLQWADADTLELLTLLASRGRLRVLGAYRRYETTERLERSLAALRSAGNLRVVDLEPLNETELRSLLATLMSVDEGPERFARWLHASSAGNVMFALETLKAMFENGTLAADTKGWHSELDAITRDYRELEAPSAISEVILRRTGRLGPTAVRTLQAAAVVGAGFSPQLLATLLESSELAEQDALEELERSGMVAGTAFRHDLIRQSVYASLAAGRRQLLHARAAQALRPGHVQTLEAERWIVVGEHLLAAGELEPAARAFGRGATDLQELGLLDQARGLYESSLARLGAATGQDDAARAAATPALTLLKTGLADCLVALGDLGAAADLLEEALATAITPELQGGALGTRARLLLRTGKLEQAGADARKAVELARRVGGRLMELNASSTLAEAEFHLGRLEEAERIVTENVTALRTEELPLALGAQLASLGAILDELGRHEEALQTHLEALEVARGLGSRHQFVNVTLNLLECYRYLERFEEAIAIAEEALALGQADGTSVLRNNLASVLLELGRLQQAEELTLPNTEVSDPTLRAMAWTRLVQIYAELGQAERLRAALGHTLETAPLTEYPVARIFAATSLLDHGDPHQRQGALELVAGIDPESLPGYLKADMLRIIDSGAKGSEAKG
ncbi:MAG: AAA family ATPase [Trueperaceae bacterium]